MRILLEKAAKNKNQISKVHSLLFYNQKRLFSSHFTKSTALFSSSGSTDALIGNKTDKYVKSNVSPTKVGDTLDLTINSIGYKNRGIAELLNGSTIIISKRSQQNLNLEDKVRVKIIKVNSHKPKFAMAELLEVLKESKNDVPVKVGEILDFTLTDLGPNGAGIVKLPGGYTLFIVNPQSLIKLQKFQIVKAQITRVKSKYAFAKIVTATNLSVKNQTFKENMVFGLNSKSSNKLTIQIPGLSETNQITLTTGTQLQVVLPKTAFSISNISGNYIITKLNGLVLFIKINLGSKFGDKVKIQLTKIEKNFIVAKVIRRFPLSRAKKNGNAKFAIKNMLKNGMHFGEKAVKCHANMKKYVWIRKKSQTDALQQWTNETHNNNNLNDSFLPLTQTGTNRFSSLQKSFEGKTNQIWEGNERSFEKDMRSTNTQEFLNSLNSETNFIRKKQRKETLSQNRPLVKKGRYLLNLLKTRRCLLQSLKQLSKYAAKGRTFLFVGTKKPATGLMARAALLTKNSFFVNTRWLGGMLTNWKTILKSISKIKPILKEKQKMIKTILEKRQDIKKRLIQKVNLLRKRSRHLIQKGQLLITKMKTEKPRLIEISQILIKKRADFIDKNQLLLKKYKQLDQKKNQLNEKSIQFQQKGNQLFSTKKILVSQLITSRKKLRELKLLLLLSEELKNFKNETINQGNDLWSISYSQFSKFLTSGSYNKMALVPNPPKPILNKIINLIRQKSDSRLFSNLLSNFSDKKNLTFNEVVRSIPLSPERGNQVILVSKLLTKLSRFIPFIQTYKEILNLRIQNIQILLTNLQNSVKLFQSKALLILDLQKQIEFERSLVKEKLLSERKILKTLKKKFQKLALEQRLLDFLPKLRYLPSPKTKMAETIQLLMKKFVDPKLRYPIDKIYDEKLKFHSKKIAATRKKKWQRLEKYFGGVTKMAKMKKNQISKNVAIIVGQKEEMNAIYECKKLGIKMFHIVDTNCNPRLADYLVPSNDDSKNSIKFVLSKILLHFKLAEKLRKKLSTV
nr:ribosomal protein S2 [Microspora sp. UTEX LB472]